MGEGVPDSGGFWRDRPPLTNRGVLTPVGNPDPTTSGAWGRVDYLKLTVWGEVGEVCGRVGDVVAEWDPDGFAGWHEAASGGRADRVLQGLPGLFVVQYKGAPYCSVELKGEACERFGNEGVAKVGRSVDVFERVRASRLDVAWDGVPFSVLDVRAQLTGEGGVRTRIRLPAVPEFRESQTGRTVYLGNPRGGERFARFYDRRGPVRFESVWKGEWAACAWMVVRRCDVAEWPGLFIGFVRDGFDLVERGGRVDRAELWGPWAAFVADAERERIVRVPRETQVTEWGMVEAAIARSSRKLRAAVRVFGAEWVLRRIEADGARKWTADDDRFVEGLAAYRYLATGQRAVPSDVPF